MATVMTKTWQRPFCYSLPTHGLLSAERTGLEARDYDRNDCSRKASGGERRVGNLDRLPLILDLHNSQVVSWKPYRMPVVRDSFLPPCWASPLSERWEKDVARDGTAGHLVSVHVVSSLGKLQQILFWAQCRDPPAWAHRRIQRSLGASGESLKAVFCPHW